MRIASLFAGIGLLTITAACATPPSTGEWAGDFRGGSSAMGLSTAQFRSDLSAAKQSTRNRQNSGDLTKDQAKALKKELKTLENLEERYSRDGLSPQEAAELDFRSQVLKDKASGQTSPSPSDAD